jgi:hypothetical protein
VVWLEFATPATFGARRGAGVVHSRFFVRFSGRQLVSGMGLVRKVVLATLLFAAATALPARAQDHTDMWWNPAESGWGVNVVQAGNNLWLTFFVYGADQRPTWYSAYLAWDGARYSGSLYATQGSYFAGPWNPGDHPEATVAGTASFQPSSINAYEATLVYTVNGVGTVVKAIERQYLGAITLTGSYVGGQSGSYANCTNAAVNGPYTDTGPLTVTQTTTTLTLSFAYGSGANCTLRGNWERRGQLFRMPGATYQCTGSLAVNTTAAVYEVKQTAQGVEGRFTATLSNGCREDAAFSAVLR